jgi:hypothetical protein
MDDDLLLRAVLIALGIAPVALMAFALLAM